MVRVRNSFISAARSSGGTLASVVSGRAPKERKKHKPRANRPLSDELVAQMKKDLLTMSTKQVAVKYGKLYATVRDIDLGLNYADVQPAR